MDQAGQGAANTTDSRPPIPASERWQVSVTARWKASVPGGRQEEAQTNGAGEEHPPLRHGFAGAGVIAAGVALAFGGEVLAIEAGKLVVGRIIGAVAEAGFTGDQETGLGLAVWRASTLSRSSVASSVRPCSAC